MLSSPTIRQEETQAQSENWHRLRDIISDRSYSEGERTTLSSGRTSSFYFNMKKTMSQPEALCLIADLTLELIRKGTCDYIGGLEMGAIPVLNAVSLRSFQLKAPLPHFWVRKKVKDHGTQSLIEGEESAVLSGKCAVMVEDVTTTGNSVLKAIQQARQLGMHVDRAITLVDRCEGAKQVLAEHNVDLLSIFVVKDFRR